MPNDEEPIPDDGLEERVRRALRIEHVLSEVTELRGQLQRIGARLSTLRAELLELGADPAIVAQTTATGERSSRPAPRIARGGRWQSRAVVASMTADLADRAADGVDVVRFDAMWAPRSNPDIVGHVERPGRRAE